MSVDTFFVDANLTLLFVAGTLDRSCISQHRRLQAYDAADYDLLVEFLGRSRRLIFPPHVYTETSNLLRQIKDPLRTQLSLGLAEMIYREAELPVESRTAVLRPEYVRLGLTDAVLLEAVKAEGATLVTADVGLYLAALSADLDAVNFNHIRDQRADFN